MRDLVRQALDDPSAAGRLVALNPDTREVARLFAEGRAYAAGLPTGWLKKTVRGSDGRERPYLLYVPKGYAPERRHRMLVDMHGGVGRAQPLDHAGLEQMKYFWAECAEQFGWFLALPSGERGAEWWTEVGAGNVLSIVRETRRNYNLDEGDLFATGFSDGGSGCFYLALAAPTPFTGFVPLNGHPGVAGAAGFQVHLRGLVNTPIYAVNTDGDQLYPSAGVKPIFAALKELGAPVVWNELEGYGHDPSYLPREIPGIVGWMDRTRRDPHPKHILWEGTGPGRVHWLSVTEVGDRGNDADFPDVNPMLPPGRVRIGIVVDQEYQGSGVRVASVADGSPAAALGLSTGDVIVGYGQEAVATFADLRRLLGGASHGGGFAVRVRRGEETLALEGVFPEGKPEPAFPRAKPHGSIEATVEGNTIDVRARRIAAFDLYLADGLVDFGEPLTVRVNGAVVHSAPVAPDLEFLVAQAARDQDRTSVYLARLGVVVPKGP